MAECPKPKVGSKDRPCFKCGKPGHRSANCPLNEKKPAARSVNSFEGAQRVLCIDHCPPPPGVPDSDGFQRSRREVKMQLGDWMRPVPKGKTAIKRKDGVRFQPLQESDMCGDNCACHPDAEMESQEHPPTSILKKALDMRSKLVGRDAKAKLAAIIADDDYDELLRRMWSKHLMSLPRSNRRVPSWGSPAWSIWMEQVDLSEDDGQPAMRYGGDAGEGMEGPDDDEVDRAMELPAGVSNVGRPPIAEEDRPVRRGDNHRGHAKGAGPESKHSQPSGCLSIGADGVLDSNDRLVELVYALAESEEAGNRAVLRAIASVSGIKSEAEVERMLKGLSKEKIKPPSHVRHLLQNMNLGHVLEPINLLIGADGPIISAEQQWQDVEFEVALDSGSVVHVAAEGDTPMYALDSSPSARQCAQFVVGAGGTMKNMWQKTLQLSSGDSDFASVFQIAAVHRPLMAVGKICDNNNEVLFSKHRAVVRDPTGAEICVFARQQGGLYTAKLKLRSPFVRPE